MFNGRRIGARKKRCGGRTSGGDCLYLSGAFPLSDWAMVARRKTATRAKELTAGGMYPLDEDEDRRRLKRGMARESVLFTV